MKRDWMILSQRRPRPLPADVVRVVSEETGVPAEHIKGRPRIPRVSHPRQLAMLLMRQCCYRGSYLQIGSALGRHHTTVMSGCRVAAARIEADSEYAALYRAAKSRLDPGSRG